MNEKASLYLSTGAQEFWVVNPKRKLIVVTRREGGTIAYQPGESIPLALFGGDLRVSEIFA